MKSSRDDTILNFIDFINSKKKKKKKRDRDSCEQIVFHPLKFVTSKVIISYN